MSNERPEVIAESNLSIAWGKLFLRLMEPGTANSPMVLTIEGFDDDGLPLEDDSLRNALDKVLTERGCMPVRKTALTIFPQEYWEFQGRPSHAEFSPWFCKWIFPQMYRGHRANRGGTYFQRMVSFGSTVSPNGKIEGTPVDQLSKILQFWQQPGTHRRSAMQASIFDPHRDHHLKPRSGFPCLQQVSFSPTSTKELAITGYYPTEYILDRGYGNYLGLCHLGRYMAHQMGLKLTRMNCVITHPLLGSAPGKTPLLPFASFIRARIDELASPVAA